MSQRKISIIMPAYNVEKTIKKAAYSCVNQSLKDIELIIVDDCSTDSTRDLMVEIKNEYPDKVKILFQEKNSRQGAARNKGYKEAEGKYILFVDSDDWIELGACKVLYECAMKNDYPDEVVGDYRLVYDNKRKTQINVFDSVRDFLGEQSIETHAVLLHQSGYFWCKMYKKEFLEKAFPDGLLFPESVQYEDSAFNTLATIQASRIEKIDYCFYNYYQNMNSTVRNTSVQLDKIEIAKYLLNTDFAKNQYKDLILYKSAILCGAVLLYGILPLYKNQSKRCREYLEELAIITSQFLRGGYYHDIPLEMRKQLEKNRKHHKMFLIKLEIKKLLRLV